MKIKTWATGLILSFANLINANESIVLVSREVGMFGVFGDVLIHLKLYEEKFYDGIEVDFCKEGLYYSPEHGENWWSYYCEPIRLGKKTNVRKVIGFDPMYLANIFYFFENGITRNEAKKLIWKYIRFKPFIINKISQFESENFAGYYVIGVHYRGTDKSVEAPRVTYETVASKVNEIISLHRGYRYKVFVATDEQNFLDYMKNLFGEVVCYNQEALRSTDGIPLHYGNYDRYQCGLDAIEDCLLLSRCQYLIKTSSNLSLWSTFFNPNLPFFELNHRY